MVENNLARDGGGGEIVSNSLSRDYIRFRKWTATITIFLAWFLITGWGWVLKTIWDLVLYWGWEDYIFWNNQMTDLLYGLMIFWGPMFFCLGIHFIWLHLFTKAYRWELTDQAVIIRKGAFRAREVKMPLAKVHSGKITQKFWERKYGWYAIEIQTEWIRAGMFLKPENRGRILGLRNPEEVKNKMIALVHDVKARIIPPEKEEEEED